MSKVQRPDEANVQLDAFGPRLTPPAHTSAAPSVGERQRPVFAARPLQLTAILVAPPIRAAHGLHLRPRADSAAVAVPVPDQPLGGARQREREKE